MKALTASGVLVYLMLTWKTWLIVKCEEIFDSSNIELESKHLFYAPWLNLKRNRTLHSWNERDKSTTENPKLNDGSSEKFLNKKEELVLLSLVENETYKDTKAQKTETLDLKSKTRRAINMGKLKEYENRGYDNKSSENVTSHDSKKRNMNTNQEQTKNKPVQELRQQICDMFNMNHINISFCGKLKSNFVKGPNSTELHTLNNTRIHYLNNIDYINFMNKLKVLMKNKIGQTKNTTQTNTCKEENSLHEKETGAASQLSKRNTDSILNIKLRADFQNDYPKQESKSNEIEDTLQTLRKNEFRQHSNHKDCYIDNNNEMNRRPSHYYARNRNKHPNTSRNMAQYKRNHDNAFHSSYNHLNGTRFKPYHLGTNKTTNGNSFRHEDKRNENLSSRFEQKIFQYVGKTKPEHPNESFRESTTTEPESFSAKTGQVLRENSEVSHTPSYRRMKNTPIDNLRYNRFMIFATLKERIFSLLLQSYQESKKYNIDPGNPGTLKNITSEIIELLHDPKYKREICESFESIRKENTANQFTPEIRNISHDPITNTHPKEHPGAPFIRFIKPLTPAQVSFNLNRNEEFLTNINSSNSEHSAIKKEDIPQLKEEMLLPTQFPFVLTTPAYVDQEETFVNKNKINDEIAKTPPMKVEKKIQILQENETPPKVLQKAEKNTKEFFIKYTPNQVKTEENKTYQDLTTLSSLYPDSTSEGVLPSYILQNEPTVPSSVQSVSLKLDNGSIFWENQSEPILGDKHRWTNLNIRNNNNTTDHATTETALLSFLEKYNGNKDVETMNHLHTNIPTNQDRFNKAHDIMKVNDQNIESNNTNNLINLRIFHNQKLHIVGDGIRIPLRFDRKPDGSFHLAVDVDTLCREKCILESNALALLHPKTNRNKFNLTISSVSPMEVANENIINETDTSQNNGRRSIGTLDYRKLRRVAEEALSYQLKDKSKFNAEDNQKEISKLLDEYDDVYNFLNSFDEKDLQEILLKLKKE